MMGAQTQKRYGLSMTALLILSSLVFYGCYNTESKDDSEQEEGTEQESGSEQGETATSDEDSTQAEGSEQGEDLSPDGESGAEEDAIVGGRGGMLKTCNDQCKMMKTCDSMADWEEQLPFLSDCEEYCTLSVNYLECIIQEMSSTCLQTYTAYYNCSIDMSCDDVDALMKAEEEIVNEACQSELDTYMENCEELFGEDEISVIADEACDEELEDFSKFAEQYDLDDEESDDELLGGDF